MSKWRVTMDVNDTEHWDATNVRNLIEMGLTKSVYTDGMKIEHMTMVPITETDPSTGIVHYAGVEG